MQKVVSRRTLYEQVFEQIKTLIVQGVYKKGDLLPTEKQLMEQMHVSRITVREAVRMLNEAGIIATRQGSGSVVLLDSSEIFRDEESRNDFQNAFLSSTRARILLEPSIAQEVARIATEEQIKMLGECARGAHKEEDFHHALVTILNNPVLEQWLAESFLLETEATPSKLVPLTQQKSVSDIIEEQHEKIYNAIRERRGDFAFFYMREHLEFVLRTHQEYFDLIYSGV